MLFSVPAHYISSSQKFVIAAPQLSPYSKDKTFGAPYSSLHTTSAFVYVNESSQIPPSTVSTERVKIAVSLLCKKLTTGTGVTPQYNSIHSVDESQS